MIEWCTVGPHVMQAILPVSMQVGANEAMLESLSVLGKPIDSASRGEVVHIRERSTTNVSAGESLP